MALASPCIYRICNPPSLCCSLDDRRLANIPMSNNRNDKIRFRFRFNRDILLSDLHQRVRHTVGIGSSRSSLVICLDNVDLLLPNGSLFIPNDVDEFPRFGVPGSEYGISIVNLNFLIAS